MGVFAVVLQVIACLGYGAAILRVTNTKSELRDDEQLAWALGLGSGVIGWLGFFLGIGGFFNSTGYYLLLAIGLMGTVFVKGAIFQCWHSLAAWKPTKCESLCLLAIGLIAVFFLSGALVPPTDADSLAYHYYLPKYFNSLGHLEFVPRAVDGSTPMLAQMAYIPVYGLGGEMGLTLWVMANGWISAFLLFSLCRRFVSVAWSLTIVLLFISVPAYVYGAGSGQVEVRIAIFVMIAAFSLNAAIQTGLLRHVIVCAIAVGFFMGAKYTGLIFALACGIVIVMQKRWFVHGLVLTFVSVLVGCQWYIWNAVHTGDPVFPMLFETLVNHVEYKFWSAEQNQLFVDNYLSSEKILDPNFINLFRYPIIATFFDLQGLESSRTGLGPYMIMALPFAIIGIWYSRKTFAPSAILTITAIITVFYIVWFFAGSPQRVRHLLPIYPLALIVMTVCAIRGAKAVSSIPILALGISLILIIQLGGAGLFSIGSMKFIIGDQSRDQFLNNNISSYPSVVWINQRLKPTDRVFIEQRELAYLLNAPIYLGHPITQTLVQPQNNRSDATKLRDQLLQQGINYLLLPSVRFIGNTALGKLTALECINVLNTTIVKKIKSRTLEEISMGTARMAGYSVARFYKEKC
jgi:hypothetical protein